MSLSKVVIPILGLLFLFGILGTEIYSNSNRHTIAFPPMSISCNDDSLSQAVIPSVTIGDQIWMAENLSMYTEEGSWYYNNSCDYSIPNGRLYFWETLMNCEEDSELVPSGVQGLCPDGWHIPSAPEWDILCAHLVAEGLSGNDLKSTESPFDGTNLTGFNAVPTGTANGLSNPMSFVNIELSVNYLTTTLDENTNAPETYALRTNTNRVVKNIPSGRTNGWSVRCIKDPCVTCPEPTNPVVNENCLDCAGVLNGGFEVDECGECLDPNDPNFNQSCADCAGIPNGVSVIDDCGECNDPNGPNFNQSCGDCAGIPNGTFVIDDCGECLDPMDPNFNLSCVDCAGIVNGTSVIDDCGECLETSDPNFNQSCADCAGIPNGSSVIDDCGECLDPNDPDFDQSCVDCAGVVDGTSVIDDCGECLDPSDPNFNQSCTDCDGIPNGASVIDDCGECLEPSDPNFNQSCIDCAGVVNGTSVLNECGICVEEGDINLDQPCSETLYIPNIFAPNSQSPNDKFSVFSNAGLSVVIDEFYIYDKWGNLIYESGNFPIEDNSQFWDGTNDGRPVSIGVYSYMINVTLGNGKTTRYNGSITLIR